MIRRLLPVVICLAVSAHAQVVGAPRIAGEDQGALSLCNQTPGSAQFCVRTLACIGAGGLYFDGQAMGWDTGTIHGQTSEGVVCEDTWQSGGFMGTGNAKLQCQDGTSVRVLYYSQDPQTGTVTGSGMDSLGRGISAWSGNNILEFLTEEGAVSATLPCGPTPIPIS